MEQSFFLIRPRSENSHNAMADDVIEIEDPDVIFSPSNKTLELNPERNVDCEISYNEFFTKFLVPNRPCVFSSEITRSWRCRREWEGESAPNFKNIDELFGGVLIIFVILYLLC